MGGGDVPSIPGSAVLLQLRLCGRGSSIPWLGDRRVSWVISEMSTAEAGVLIAILMGVGEVVKLMLPGLNWHRWGPVFLLCLGVLLGVVAHLSGDGLNSGLFHGVLIGAGLGLSAAGLYNGADRIFGEIKNRGHHGKSTNAGGSTDRR